MNMDHLEKEQIDNINRRREEVKWNRVITDDDTKALTFGLKRTFLALLTAALFVVSVLGFIKVATATGYIAVLTFFGSVLALLASFVLLYAQGITKTESKGDCNEK
jgi:uncharacterized Tic20 family protein